MLFLNSTMCWQRVPSDNPILLFSSRVLHATFDIRVLDIPGAESVVADALHALYSMSRLSCNLDHRFSHAPSSPSRALYFTLTKPAGVSAVKLTLSPSSRQPPRAAVLRGQRNASGSNVPTPSVLHSIFRHAPLTTLASNHTLRSATFTGLLTIILWTHCAITCVHVFPHPTSLYLQLSFWHLQPTRTFFS
jgi:hypothetical protein